MGTPLSNRRTKTALSISINGHTESIEIRHMLRNIPGVSRKYHLCHVESWPCCVNDIDNNLIKANAIKHIRDICNEIFQAGHWLYGSYTRRKAPKRGEISCTCSQGEGHSNGLPDTSPTDQITEDKADNATNDAVVGNVTNDTDGPRGRKTNDTTDDVADNAAVDDVTDVTTDCPSARAANDATNVTTADVTSTYVRKVKAGLQRLKKRRTGLVTPKETAEETMNLSIGAQLYNYRENNTVNVAQPQNTTLEYILKSYEQTMKAAKWSAAFHNRYTRHRRRRLDTSFSETGVYDEEFKKKKEEVICAFTSELVNYLEPTWGPFALLIYAALEETGFLGSALGQISKVDIALAQKLTQEALLDIQRIEVWAGLKITCPHIFIACVETIPLSEACIDIGIPNFEKYNFESTVQNNIRNLQCDGLDCARIPVSELLAAHVDSLQSNGPIVESSKSTISIQIKAKTQAQTEGIQRSVPLLSRQSTTTGPLQQDPPSHSESFCHIYQSSQSNDSSGDDLEASASNDDNGDDSTTGQGQRQSPRHTNTLAEASLGEVSLLQDKQCDIVQDLAVATSPSRNSPMIGHSYSLDEVEDTRNNTEGWLETLRLAEQSPHDELAGRDNPPPAKRRKKAPSPKERTTEYLDLTKPDNNLNDQDSRQLDRLVTALRKKKKIVVIAGAGISVSAGIPDFRSSTGLFATARTQHKLQASGKQLFDASVYNHDETTESFHTMIRELAEIAKNAEPTPFHHLLASLAKEGRLMRLYSQNIDCIDTNMEPLSTNIPLNTKSPWPTTIQLHGGLQNMVCTKCGSIQAFEAELFIGPETPLCKDCVLEDEVRTTLGKRGQGIGRLRPRLLLYNEYNPDEEAVGMVSSADIRTCPDAVIVVGTSLKVPGTRRLVKELCQVTRSRKNGFTVWINLDSEPKGANFKDCWDLVVQANCDDIARLVALPP